MMDIEIIKNSLNDEFIESETYTAFENINVFINYALSIDDVTKYQTRSNRILMVLDENWIGDIIEISSVIENDIIQYSQFKINNFVAKLKDNTIIPLTPKPNNAKRHEWEENFSTCQQIEINFENMRDALISYCERRKEEILEEKIRNYGSLEVYESIQKYRRKIDDIYCEISFLEEQELIHDEEIEALIQQKNKLQKYVDIASEEKIKVEDVIKRTFNISNIKKKLN